MLCFPSVHLLEWFMCFKPRYTNPIIYLSEGTEARGSPVSSSSKRCIQGGKASLLWVRWIQLMQATQTHAQTACTTKQPYIHTQATIHTHTSSSVAPMPYVMAGSAEIGAAQHASIHDPAGIGDDECS